MGAIAVSKDEERRIDRLRKELRIPTKSGLIRVALTALERKTEEGRLRREIEKSARRFPSFRLRLRLFSFRSTLFCEPLLRLRP